MDWAATIAGLIKAFTGVGIVVCDRRTTARQLLVTANNIVWFGEVVIALVPDSWLNDETQVRQFVSLTEWGAIHRKEIGDEQELRY